MSKKPNGYWNTIFDKLFDKNYTDNVLGEYQKTKLGKDNLHYYVTHLVCKETHEVLKGNFARSHGRCSNPLCSKNKQNSTNMIKYGSKTPAQNNTIKSKISSSLTNKSQKEKEATRLLVEKTNLLRYGNRNSLLSNSVKEKIHKTNLEKYGSIYPLNNKNVRGKMIKTRLKNHLSGKIDYSNNHSFGKKIKLIGYDKIYRSTWDALFQILNPLTLYEKIKIPYDDGKNIKRVYIPDFLDEKNKLIIEIKPDYKIYRLIEPLNIFKFEAAKLWCKSNGYTFIILGDSWYNGIINKTILNEYLRV